MPILKMEGRLWHLAKKMKRSESWGDNEDLRLFPEVQRQENEMSLLPPFVWVANNTLVLGYRPYGVFVAIAGAFILVNFILDFISFIASGDLYWFWSFLVSLFLGLSMVYYGLFSRFRRFIAFDRQRGLVHFAKPFSGRYISVPWKDAHFMKIRWHVPKGWERGKNDVDFFYFLPPPFRSPFSGLLSYGFRKQVICPGYEPDEQWWMIVHFMCHGPEHHKNMAKMLADRQENCDAFFNGDMKAMQYFVGTKIKVLSHGAGNFEWPFTYGKEWKHLDMAKLPQAPTHVIGPDSKWKKLKKHERDDHVPGPAWESLAPEQAVVIFEGEEKGKKSGDRKAS